MTSIAGEDARQIANAPLSWGKLRGKHVLISGANGYVPQFFVHGLLARNDLFQEGITVIALCRSEGRAAERFSDYFDRQDFRLIIDDVAKLTEVKEPVDFIIHAASPASMKARYADPVAVFDANVTGCRKLLGLAEQKGAELLLLSSVDVYGSGCSEKLKETFSGSLDPLDPRNAYACAKRAAETLCCCYAAKGVPCKIVRPFQILGSGVSLDDGRLHADFISQMLRGDTITLKGDGTPRRSFLYVTDAIVGMLTVLLEGRSGKAYNIGDESGEASVLELARLMASLVPGRDIRVVYDLSARGDPAVTRALSVVLGDYSKLRQLGWRPAVSLREACARTMACYGL